MSKNPGLKCGDTVYMPKLQGGIPHLWILITEPDEAGGVAMVNITTPKSGADETVILDRGDHHRITHRSVVYYVDAKIVSVDSIEAAINGGVCVQCDACSLSLLRRIQAGVSKSRFTPRKVIEYCQRSKSWPL